jgi:hypothetical protein
MTSYAQTDARAGAAEGWAMFAGIIMAIAGISDIIFGLTAIFKDEALTRVGGHTIVWDFTTWGWITLLIGILMVLAAFGLFAGQSWAMWTTVVFASLAAIGQIRLDHGVSDLVADRDLAQRDRDLPADGALEPTGLAVPS